MDIYDIIHGNINIDSLAKRIIDTEEFQRLRNIKQLGCCNFVFPSATHTRFEHSLGVYHLAKKYIQILNTDTQFTDNDIKCITIGALIHDIGHGPYSHLFDEIVDKNKNHEYRSIELLKLMNHKYNLELSDNDIIQIKKIIYPINISCKKDKKYLYQIVSNNNGIDVDRFDYIIRDIKMTGLNYGIEYERIMNHSQIIDGEIVYSEKVKTSIDEFFRIRFIMYKEVYNHHTVRAIEYMMKDFIKGMDKIINISNIIENEVWEDFIRLNDSIIDRIYQYKKMINHITFTNLWPDFQNYDSCSFWKIEKDIKSDQAVQNKIKIINKLIELIDNIRIRNIYKSVGEIISDSKIQLDGYNTEHIIVDSVKLSYNGKLRCKYIQNRETINKSLKIQNKDEYITTIYYKSDLFKKEAEDLFKRLKDI